MNEISKRRLAALLGVSKTMLGDLHKQKILQYHQSTAGASVYAYEEVNAFLGARSQHFDPPLTVEALIKRQVVLISTRIASRLCGKTVYNTLKWLRAQKVPVVKIGAKVYRFEACAVQAKVFLPTERMFTPKEVAAMLNVKPPAVIAMMKNRILGGVELGPHTHLIGQSEVVRILQLRVKGRIRPLKWIEGIGNGTIQLVRSADASRQLGVSREKLNRMAAARKLDFVQDAAGRRSFTQVSIDTIKAEGV